MLISDIHITRRHLPHWTAREATYFVTFRTKNGELTVGEQEIALDHIKQGHGLYYALIAAIVMPDHAHLLLTPNRQYTLDRVMKGLKGVSAHKINDLRGCGGSVWQDESYDRIVRNQTELLRFLNYMLLNPVKKNLCDDPWLYPGWYCNLQEIPVM
jgi:REP element-mobilizing transposase RayT